MISVVSDPSRRSDVPGIANNMSTPVIENMLQDSRSTNLSPSEEMSTFLKNLSTPGSHKPMRYLSTTTPLGVGRQRSLSLNLNLSLKEELELAMSDTSSNVVENTTEKTQPSDLPESGVDTVEMWKTKNSYVTTNWKSIISLGKFSVMCMTCCTIVITSMLN